MLIARPSASRPSPRGSQLLYQAKHTGTPWGQALLPPTPIGLTFQDFAGGNEHEGWILLLLLIPLVVIGVFGATVDRRHIDLDLHTRSPRCVGKPRSAHDARDRHDPGVGSAAPRSSRGTRRSCSRSSCSSSRGITCFADPNVRTWVLVAVVALGFVGGVRNVITQRTTAGKVDAILRKHAKPGDVVLYCPDQLGPAVHRLVQPGLDEMTYPLLRPPALVDWVDYKAVLRRHKPAVVAQEVLARAGSHTIWYVSAPGYQTHVGTCDAVPWPGPGPPAAIAGRSERTTLREARAARVPGALTMRDRSGSGREPRRVVVRGRSRGRGGAVAGVARVGARVARGRADISSITSAARPARSRCGRACSAGTARSTATSPAAVTTPSRATVCGSSRCSRSRVARSGCSRSSTRAAVWWSSPT